MKMTCVAVLISIFFAGCSSLIPKGRVFLDSSSHKDSPPKWVEDTKTSWEDGAKIMLRSSHTVRGDERVNGCFDLARLDGKEAILTEIANEVRGTLDNAQHSLSESAENVLGKVRSSEYRGRVTGLRYIEQYYERYAVTEVERVDCHVLGQIDMKDYKRLKQEIVDRVVAADPRIKDAITQKHIDFFGADRAVAGGNGEK